MEGLCPSTRFFQDSLSTEPFYNMIKEKKITNGSGINCQICALQEKEKSIEKLKAESQQQISELQEKIEEMNSTLEDRDREIEELKRELEEKSKPPTRPKRLCELRRELRE